ncbi:vitamin b12 abc transporter, b12-binding component btuf [hydrocarbon metagenome]|uniref:Vitamin b12 abc transporter, b12-binding component btuf n=1 Tax=hydrocarbon metagenome TaxID=938273 RepID=A0A0W8FSS9_9ZZZZ
MRKQFKSTNSILLILFTAVFTVFHAHISCARMVTDEIGRNINIISTPQRIVSLAPGLTEILYALGLDEKIVGVTSYCNWPTRARQKTRIGGFTNPSVEKIVSLKPDLIIVTADGNRKDIMQKLERIGLSVYVTNPSDTAGILKSILDIGEITNGQKEAGKLVEKLQKRLNNIAEQIKHKSKPRVFFQIGLEPVITVGKGTLINETIERAGGFNVAGLDTARYPRYSAEGIMQASPEIVLFAPMANDREFVAVKKFWQELKGVPAVKNNKIYPVNTDLIGRASPRIVDAIEKMAMIFHPEIKDSIR